MAKKLSDAEYDEGLQKTASANLMCVCAGEPTDYNDAVTVFPGGKRLAGQVMVPYDGGTPDYFIEAGPVDGRSVRAQQKAGVVLEHTGTQNGDHVAHLNTTNTELLMVTTCTSIPLTGGGGNSVTFPEHRRNVRAPT